MNSRLELTRVGNFDFSFGFPGLSALCLHLLNYVQSLNNLSEDSVLAIEPLSLHSTNEELAAVGVGTSIGHGQSAWASVLELEVLISELLSVDGLTSCSISIGEVSTLTHEIGNNSVEDAALEVKGLSSLSCSLLTSAKSTEVLSSLGYYVSKELHYNPALWAAADGDFEEHSWVRHYIY